MEGSIVLGCDDSHNQLMLRKIGCDKTKSVLILAFVHPGVFSTVHPDKRGFNLRYFVVYVLFYTFKSVTS